MSISGVANTTSSTLVQPKDAVGSKSLHESDFMKLFITQLQYQDPMKPMDNYQMASQLAQFSNMQATTKMSDNMKKLLDYQTSQNNLQLLSLLNTKVLVSGDKIGVKGGTPGLGDFTLSDASNTTTVQVYNNNDQLVWQEDRGGLAAGHYDLKWDGKDMFGKTVPDGAYYYKVKALDATGHVVDVDSKSSGLVTGVDFSGASPAITLDGHIQVGADDIQQVIK
ncbi:MAG TPA: flagellar hook assembly protein FlgD [Desulfobacterales bacterium]|nr:flagellar hook assembly protein FlgD [Desulfobacterales bacterium]